MIEKAYINGHEVTFNAEISELTMFGKTYKLTSEDGCPVLTRYDEESKFWVVSKLCGTEEETKEIEKQLIAMLSEIYVERVLKEMGYDV